MCGETTDEDGRGGSTHILEEAALIYSTHILQMRTAEEAALIY